MNKKAIINVIKNDATLRNIYSDDNGNMCVIGGLAFECGISKEYLMKCGGVGIGNLPAMMWDCSVPENRRQIKNLGKVRRLIKGIFGLSVEDTMKHIKDFHHNFDSSSNCLSITKNSVKVGFSFYFHGLLYPANIYCIRVNLKMPKGRRLLFSKYL